ncbi:MAG: UbiX family flavin prenyltransferase [Deltaproteobacteria bacterium]|nr:UbiX family flavin prenyltransferase [Deltaproteobacteria bacterium]
MERSQYILAFTGASGAPYGLKLLSELLKRDSCVDTAITPAALLILKEEVDLTINSAEDILNYLNKSYKGNHKGKFTLHAHDDLTSPLASGSSLNKKMIIAPCSMGSLARIATGVSSNLIERAADCVIKEAGELVLVPRETPLSPIHLENMLKLSRIDVQIVPAMPAFYNAPKSIEDMVDFVVGKVLDALRIENDLYKRWSGES